MPIHMLTEEIAALEARLKQLGVDMFDGSGDLKNALSWSAWEGPGAEEFRAELRAVCARLGKLADEAVHLSLAVTREREQWLETDLRGVKNLKGICDPPRRTQDPSLGVVVDEMVNLVEDAYYRKRYEEFTKYWDTLDRDQKQEYLQSLIDRLAKKYGWPKTMIVLEDLDDSSGDARGVNVGGGVIVLDTSNVDGGNPWRVIETAVHENRHEYQRQAIEAFKQDGSVPDGMTRDQVEQWVSESDNYTSPDDDFEKYYNQAVERDARDQGDQAMKDFLDEWDHPSGGGGAW